MDRTHFRTRAALERQIDAARQLRAETLGGAAWIVSAFAAAFRAVRRLMRLLTTWTPRSV